METIYKMKKIRWDTEPLEYLLNASSFSLNMIDSGVGFFPFRAVQWGTSQEKVQIFNKYDL